MRFFASTAILFLVAVSPVAVFGGQSAGDVPVTTVRLQDDGSIVAGQESEAVSRDVSGESTEQVLANESSGSPEQNDEGQNNDEDDPFAGNKDRGIVTGVVAFGLPLATITVASLLSLFLQKTRPRYNRWAVGACVLGALVVAGALVITAEVPGLWLYPARIAIFIAVCIVSLVVSTFKAQATDASRSILNPTAISVVACLSVLCVWHFLTNWFLGIVIPAAGISRLGLETFGLQQRINFFVVLCTCGFVIFAGVRAIYAKVVNAFAKKT